MGTKLRWGIMAPGGISLVILKDFRLAGIEVHAVGSRSMDRAQAYAKTNQVAKAYGSYEDLVADPDLDVIYISSPHPAHFPNAMLALQAGKHVLLEKPFTINASEAKKLVDLARSKKLFVMEAMWTRFLPNHVDLFSKISDGIIGRPLYLIADHNQYLPASKAARLHDPELGGGALLDLGVYPISLAHRLFGKPSRIQASSVLMHEVIDESTATIFDYSSGAQAMTHSSVRVDGPIRAFILGDKGRVELEKSFYDHTPFTVFDQSNQVVYRYEGKIEGRGMQYQALEVERCIEAGLTESTIMPLDETIEIMQVMDEVRALTGIKYPGE